MPKIKIDDRLPALAGHHAYLVLGGETLAAEALFSFPVLGINEARILKERAQLGGEERELSVWCGGMTEEGQNALLKTLEEPAHGVIFIFLAPASIQLLPTLRSRFAIIEPANPSRTDLAGIANFVKAKPEVRLKLIAELIKKAGDNHKSEAIKFLDSLEKYLAQKFKVEEMSPEMIFALAEIRHGREYLYDKSGTSKLILDHIALVLPTTARTDLDGRGIW